MKKLFLLLAMFGGAVLLAACGGDPTPTPAPPTSTPVPQDMEEPTAVPGEEVTWYVGPELAECTGVAPQTCLLLKENPDDEYMFFYDNIEGFDYEEGYEYEIIVRIEPVENPPADASAFHYTLVEVVSKTPAAQEVTWYVGPELVECVGVGPQTCLQVKENPEAEYTLFYGSIDGFAYEEGYEYELIVSIKPVENPPADASAFSYTLVEEVSKTPVEMAEITGTVTYLARIALPPDAILSVQLQDTSLADAPAVVLGEDFHAAEGAQVPLPFAIPYNPADIQDNHDYSLSARITDGAGKLLFINDTRIPVITKGNPTTDIEVMVVPVGGSEAGEEMSASGVAALVNKQWQWEHRELADGGQAFTIADPTSYVLAFTEDGMYVFQADCNSGSGVYTADDEGGIIMQPGITTLAECGPESHYNEMVQSFTAVQTYQLAENGEVLVLDLPGEGAKDYYRNAGEMMAEAEPAGGLPEELLGQPWQWVGFTNPATGPEEVAAPENYRVQFEPDGTVFIQADCNTGSGIYSAVGGPDSGSMSIIPGPMTRAFCGEDSLDGRFMEYLTAAAIWFTQDGDLYFDLKFDGGTMQFAAETEADGGEDITATAPESESSDTIPPDAIQIDLQGLADSYTWEARGSTQPAPGPGGAPGMPAHIILTFDGETADEALANNGRYLYIFPVEGYENLGGQSATTQIERLQELIAEADGRTEIPDDPMPLLPPPMSYMNRWAQFADLNFTGDVNLGEGTGVRYVSEAPNRQSIGPWTNQGTAYYYQGLTADGRFYLSLHWPVSTEALPNTFEETPEDIKAQSTDPEAYDTYLQATKDTLNDLEPTDWTPDLAELDALVASITFQ